MKQALLIILLSYSITWAQVYMNIKNKDGTTKNYNIEDIKKLTFDGVEQVNINIKNKDETTQTYKIDDIMKLTFSAPMSDEDGEELANIIKTFSLLQNYPNPFNPSTTIEYQIPEAGFVEANIYNISGQLVLFLENNFQSAGSHKLSWDSRNNLGQKVASGIYLFRVKYNQTSLTKKIMLIK